MSSKTLLFCLLTSLLLTLSCGPAAEDRNNMVTRATQVQDSIANVIKAAMAEAAAPGPDVMMVPAGSPSPQGSPSAQAGPGAPLPQNPMPNQTGTK